MIGFRALFDNSDDSSAMILWWCDGGVYGCGCIGDSNGSSSSSSSK